MTENVAFIDVTDQTRFGLSDDEFLPITRCVCGKQFDYWDFMIDMSAPTPCPSCGRELIFEVKIVVYVVEDKESVQ